MILLYVVLFFSILFPTPYPSSSDSDGWSEWSAWSACGSDEQQHRYRRCLVSHPTYSQCKGGYAEARLCTGNYCAGSQLGTFKHSERRYASIEHWRMMRMMIDEDDEILRVSSPALTQINIKCFCNESHYSLHFPSIALFHPCTPSSDLSTLL